MECGGVSGKGGEKNTTRRVEIFLATCFTLVRYVFSE
jgi:hypothetical protein